MGKRRQVPDGVTPILLDYSQAAALLGISRRKLEQLAAAKRIDVVKIGRLARISHGALQRFIEGQEQQTAAN